MQIKDRVNPDNSFLEGVKGSIPIAVGYFPIAVAFGVMAANAGISSAESFSMSVFVFAGASQFMAAEMISSGITAMEIAIAVFILNFRHFIMSLSVFHRLKEKNRALRALLAFGVTDETFAVISFKEGINSKYVLGLMLFSYISWVAGTLSGGLFFNLIPPGISSSMAIGLYAMFIGLLVPQVVRNPKILMVCSAGMVFNFVLVNFFNKGIAIIIATLAAAISGSLLIESPEAERGDD